MEALGGRPLGEAVIVKPGWCWRQQNHGVSARDLHAGSGTRLIKRSVLQSAKLDMLSHRSHLTGSRVCPDRFWSFLGPLFPQYAPIPLFWNANIYSVLLYMTSM